MSLTDIQPSLHANNFIFNIKLSPTMVFLKHNIVGALFLALNPPLSPPNQHENSLKNELEFPFLLMQA
jgi:hypothetical protein